MNNNFIANNSLYYLQKGPNGTSILRDPLKHTDGRLGYKGRGYIRKETSLEKRDKHFPRKKEQVRKQRNTL